MEIIKALIKSYSNEFKSPVDFQNQYKKTYVSTQYFQLHQFSTNFLVQIRSSNKTYKLEIVFQIYNLVFKKFSQTIHLVPDKMQPNPNNLPNQQVDIFSIAFNQRKRINLQKLEKFFKDRLASTLQRRRIFILIQDTLYEKIQATRQTIKQFIRFFEDIVSWFELILKHIKKVDLDKKAKEHCEFEVFQSVINKVLQVNSQQAEEIQSFSNWIQKTVITALKNALDGFKDSTKILRRQVESIFNNADGARFDEVKLYDKMQQGDDLLENQFYLIEKLQKTDIFNIEWGQKLLKNWKQLLRQESDVRELLRGHVIEYNRRHCKIFNSTDTNKNLNEFWSKLQKQPQIKTIFVSFLSEKDIEFMSFGCKKSSFYDKFQEFINLQHQKERVGSMLQLIQILQNKYFKCKVQKDKKEWIETKLYFSLDQHILIYDQEKKKLILKINSRNVQGKKITENMVELKGKEVGMIFDSTRKQTLHFKTIDEVEEFIFYIENIMKENNPQEKEKK